MYQESGTAREKAERCAALARYDILDTPAEADFDDLVRVASVACAMPVSLISLLDGERQWFKARIGLDPREMPIDSAICAHAIRQSDLFVVGDTTRDPRTATNPLVTGDPHVRFYAGMPLRTPDGVTLGTLCVLDTQPRELTETQAFILRTLSRQVMALLELRRTLRAHQADAAFLKSVLGASGDCIKVLDLDARLTFMTEGGQRIMEVSDFNAIQGCPWPDFWHDQGNLDAKAAVAAAQAGGTGHFQGEAATMAGTPKWWDVQVTPILGPDGAPAKILSVSRDITDRKRDEQRLAKSEERLSLALNASGIVGTWDWDVKADLIHADATFAALYGVDPAWAERGAPMSEFVKNIHSDDRPRVRAEIDRVFAGDDNFACEYRVCQPDGSARWVFGRGRLIRDATGAPVRFPGATVEITALKQAEERQVLLTGELQHRIKNTLAMVQAIAGQTLRDTDDIAAAREAFTARLITLGRAHDILTQASWTEAPIAEVVEGALAVHRPADPDRIRVDGPPVRLDAQQALSLALALHELATNATKYGALSNATGTVRVAWAIEGQPGGERPFRLTWREAGGPPVAPPTRTGFGSRLIRRSLGNDFGGTVDVDYAPGGVVCTLVGCVGPTSR